MISVAIVEDNQEIRESLKAVIDSSEDVHCASAFSNAEDASDQLPLIRPDVVLMDIGLPGMSGIDCIRNIRGSLPGTQILMFTVFEDDQQIFDALKRGANGYLLKRTPPDRILMAIQEVMDGGSPMSPGIARKVVSFFNSGDTSPSEGLLTKREMEVLTLLSNGFLYKEIAEKLTIAVGTVKRHLHGIYEKLHVQNKTEAINKVFPRRVI